MNLYEFEGKSLFAEHGIAIPRGFVVQRGDDIEKMTHDFAAAQGISEFVVKAQVLSGKRGKNNAIRCVSIAQSMETPSRESVREICNEIFAMQVHGQYVAAIRIEEKLSIEEEHYLSISYDSQSRQPILVYSTKGGVDIEDVSDTDIRKIDLDIRKEILDSNDIGDIPYAQELWNCFLAEDTRQVEINPLVKTAEGEWVAADAKVALDDDAFYRHESWKHYEARTMMGRLPTEREKEVAAIDAGEEYYRGTAGKYIEMDGDIAILFSGGGASIANMDALITTGLKPANYTEYSGNPPREKVRDLAKIVLSKPGLKGLWIAGGVANFTNIKETFHGIVDALDEIKPAYPIVVRRAGPYEREGMELLRECATRNHLAIKFFGKETSMSETAGILAQEVKR